MVYKDVTVEEREVGERWDAVYQEVRIVARYTVQTLTECILRDKALV